MAQHFHHELKRLENRLLLLTAVVEESFRNAIRSVENRDLDLAASVADNDQRTNSMEVEIEDDCRNLLALHKPVAHDLRFIVTALKMTNDLERIGDFAARIAEKGKLLAEYPSVALPADFPAMADLARSLFQRSVDTLINMDAREACNIIALDKRVDQYMQDINNEVVEWIKQTPETIAACINILWMVLALERVGDHASNIAEDVVYLIEGDIVRHQINAIDPENA